MPQLRWEFYMVSPKFVKGTWGPANRAGVVVGTGDRPATILSLGIDKGGQGMVDWIISDIR